MKFHIIIVCIFFVRIIAASPYPIITNKSEKYLRIHDELFLKRLDITTFNTWGLPINLPRYNQKVRFVAIPDSVLHLQSDIVGLQETFHPSLRKGLYNAFLAGGYYTKTDCECNRKIVPLLTLDCFGGLMTFSRFPIMRESFFPFPKLKSSSFIEGVGRKGFLVTDIKKGREVIRVINTHLYAGIEVEEEMFRLEQIKYMDSILQSIDATNVAQIILLGDFNIHFPVVDTSIVYNYIVSMMSYIDTKPTIDESDFTMNKFKNKYVSTHEPLSKLDYIFIKNMSLIHQARCVFDGQTPISDHFGFQISISTH